MVDNMDDKDTIEVQIKHDSSEEIFNKLKEAYEKGQRTGKQVLVKVWKSKWDQMGARKFIMKAAEKFGGMSLEKIGAESPLAKFERNLEDLGYPQKDIDRLIDNLYIIRALESVGMFYDPSSKPLKILGYPEDVLKDGFIPEDDIFTLKQLESIVRTKGHGLEIPSIRVSGSRGEDIIIDYIEEVMDESKERIDELIENHPVRLMYSVFHEETIKYPYNEIFSVRPYEDWGFRDTSLAETISRDIEDITLSYPQDEEKGDLSEIIKEFWDGLNSLGLSVEAPIINRRKSEEYSGVTTTAYKRTSVSDFSQGCLPYEVSERLMNLIIDKLGGENSEEIIDISILMSINKHSENPRKLEQSISSRRNKYGLTIDDMDQVRSVINRLSEEGITSRWSDTGDIPYTVKNYKQFLKFCKDYLLGEKELR